jgi:hypothetical protein
MTSPAFLEPPVIVLDHRASTCVVAGCGGAVVRHSLGAGQAVHRCARCFRRYEMAPAHRIDQTAERGRLRRMLDELVSWRE